MSNLSYDEQYTALETHAELLQAENAKLKAEIRRKTKALNAIIKSQPASVCGWCQGTGKQQEFECSACGGSGNLYDEQAWIAYRALFDTEEAADG